SWRRRRCRADGGGAGHRGAATATASAGDDVGYDLRLEHLAVDDGVLGPAARDRWVVARAELGGEELEGNEEEGERGGDRRQGTRPPHRARGPGSCRATG